MWQVARRPRWIGALVLCLAIAAGFAALGQWQISRSVEDGTIIDRDSETIVPLEQIAEPQATITTRAAGQRVSFTASTVDGDWVIVGERSNAGVAGYWVIAHALVGADDAQGATDATAPSLAVALGWAPTRQAAASVIATSPRLDGSFTGRFLATEPPAEDDFENGEQQAVSVAALINQWVDAPSSVYGGYVVLDEAPAGLDTIDSPVPTSEVTLNWLNIFYAVEWAVFAVFAVFLWFRLVKDEWQRELEDAEYDAALRAQAASPVELN
ncbi:MAG: SURF1 family protein [Microbacteriaceae bacterium]